MRRHLGPSWRTLAALFALAGCNAGPSASSIVDASLDDAAIDASALAPPACADGPSLVVAGARQTAYEAPTALTDTSIQVALPGPYPAVGALVDPESGDLFVHGESYLARVDAQGNLLWSLDMAAGILAIDQTAHTLVVSLDEGVGVVDARTGVLRVVAAGLGLRDIAIAPDGTGFGMTRASPTQVVWVGRDGAVETSDALRGLGEIVGADCEHAYVLDTSYGTSEPAFHTLVALRLADHGVAWRLPLEHIEGIVDSIVLADGLALVVARRDTGMLEHGLVSRDGVPRAFAPMGAAASGPWRMVATPDGGDVVVTVDGLHAFSPEGTMRTSSASVIDVWQTVFGATPSGRLVTTTLAADRTALVLHVTSLDTLLVERSVAVPLPNDCTEPTFRASPTGAYLVDCDGTVRVLAGSP